MRSSQNPPNANFAFTAFSEVRSLSLRFVRFLNEAAPPGHVAGGPGPSGPARFGVSSFARRTLRLITILANSHPAVWRLPVLYEP